MTRAKQNKIIKKLTVFQLKAVFPDEAACEAFLVAHRWSDVACPRCGSLEGVFALQIYRQNPDIFAAAIKEC